MISSLDTRIAFFGGAANIAAIEAVAQLAAAGFEVVAGSHDPRESQVLAAAGVSYESDRVELLRSSQVVLTSLATPQDVEEAYLGEQGLLELVDPGTYVVDLSFSTPQLARELHAVGAISDVYVVDAPVVNLGEHEQAISYVGGDKEALEALSPLFPYLAPTVYPQQAAGEGQQAAMLAHIALAGALVGAVEAVAMARINGFSDKAALTALAASSGGSRALIDYIPKVLARDFSGRISVAEFLDALDVVLDASEANEVTLPMVETAYQLYELLSTVGGAELNIQAIALLYEDEQTCSEYGLDWSRADDARGMGFDDFGDDFDDDDEGGRRSPCGGPFGMPPFGMGSGPIGGIFSRN